jgi:hypothetical protein
MEPQVAEAVVALLHQALNPDPKRGPYLRVWL